MNSSSARIGYARVSTAHQTRHPGYAVLEMGMRSVASDVNSNQSHGTDTDAIPEASDHFRNHGARALCISWNAYTEVGTDAVGALAASGTSAGSISLTAPSTAGAYYYGACVDAVTDESDTTNNCSSSVTIAVEEESSGQPGLEDRWGNRVHPS